MLTDRHLRLLFYIVWTSTLLLQCSLVGLSGDEAYYWRYSRELAWGYFDHPPVTAALVKAGYFLFNNELGVRLFFATLLTLMILVLENLVRPKDLKLFYAIVLSIAFLQVGMVWGGGMMAIPDFPLLFFEAIFFLLYRRYLETPAWHVSVLMAVTISLMLLTKYHGILIIGFTVLSNLRLLARPSFWMVAGLSLALLLPHVLWQVSHDFPSVRYHLFERSTSSYSFSYTTEYLGGQLFILGPIIGVLLIFLVMIFKPANDFERSLKFVAIGTYSFFMLMTFKGQVEANWTIITLIPLVIMGYKQIVASQRLRSVTMYCFVASILLIAAARVVITLHVPLPRVDKFNESVVPWTWCADLKERTAGLPAAFINSYQKAALYEFYEGVPSFSLNNIWGRKNQYSIWDTEAAFQGKDVALVFNWGVPSTDSIRIVGEYFPYETISNFRSSSNLWITSDLPGLVRTNPSATLTTNLRLNNATENVRDFESNPDFPTVIMYAFFQGTTSRMIEGTSITVKNYMIESGEAYSTSIKVPAEPGRYLLYFTAGTGWLPPGINSSPVEVIVAGN
jgi:hypothetical protein